MADSEQKVPLKARVAGRFSSWLIRFLFASSKKVYLGREHIETMMKNGQRFILVSWHNRNILAAFSYLSQKVEGRELTPLASASKDGTIAAVAMKALGIDCIRGSSSRGGTRALRAMLRNAKKGFDLAITPDGPRGPKYVVQPGVVTTAKMTGLPLLPVAYCAKRHKRLRSWDAMIVPKPFTTLQFVYGEPIWVPRKTSEAELEAIRVEIEASMMRCVARSEDFSEPVS